MLKLQSAMEYLMTYSWALLVIAIIVATMMALGLFNPGVFTNTQCTFPAGFSCINIFLATNGLLSLNLLQITTAPLNISAMGCNSNSTLSHMQSILNPPTNQIKLNVGSNYTFHFSCYSGVNIITPSTGTSFSGYVFVNYTETVTGLPHTVFGTIYLKATR